jgi:hypothetical protein
LHDVLQNDLQILKIDFQTLANHSLSFGSFKVLGQNKWANFTSSKAYSGQLNDLQILIIGLRIIVNQQLLFGTNFKVLGQNG